MLRLLRTAQRSMATVPPNTNKPPQSSSTMKHHGRGGGKQKYLSATASSTSASTSTADSINDTSLQNPPATPHKPTTEGKTESHYRSRRFGGFKSNHGNRNSDGRSESNDQGRGGRFPSNKHHQNLYDTGMNNSRLNQQSSGTRNTHNMTQRHRDSSQHPQHHYNPPRHNLYSRNYHTPNQHQQHPRQKHRHYHRNKKRNEAQIQIRSTNFLEMHQQCQAARYKVHRPQCSCSKIQQVKKRIQRSDQDLDGLVVLPDINFVPMVYHCSNTELNGAYAQDALGCERILRDKIFPPKDANEEIETLASSLQKATLSASKNNAEPQVSFKVSCANCLLQDQPNGFLCLTSPHKTRMEAARDQARQAALAKINGDGALHADHAHFVCSLPTHLLWDLLCCHQQRRRQNKKLKGNEKVSRRKKQEQEKEQDEPADEQERKEREKERLLTQEVWKEMINQGVTMTKRTTFADDSETTIMTSLDVDRDMDMEIDMGHHLTTYLNLTHRFHPRAPPDSHSNKSNEFLLVLIYNDTDATKLHAPPKFALDLPGGKRHLGETSWEGVVRETEEECSLQIEDWECQGEGGGGKQQLVQKGEKGNVYFVLCPPEELGGG